MPNPIIMIAAAVLFLLQGCDLSPENDPLTLDTIRQHGELVVHTRYAPTIYYIDREGNGAGVDHDLIAAYAASLGLEVRFEIHDTLEEIFDALKNDNGHIAAAGLTEFDKRKQNLLASDPYQHVAQQVVCRRGGQRPTDIEALTTVNMSVVAQSSYVNQLKTLKRQHPELLWQTVNDTNTEELLQRVWAREIDCTLADSNIVAINRRYYPELVTPFNLIEEEPLVWYMPKRAAPLQHSINQWLADYKQSGRLDQLLERYYGYVEIFDYVDTRKYVDRINKRLPKYEQLFKQAAQQYDLPWTLLAAQSYQESHWNTKAISPTGVRGLMMLTLATSREMGVTNRLDPQQSIDGGAKYLNRLRQRLPEEITEPDRTWLALAAYNVGMGHLKDARTLAQRLNKNPDSWVGLKDVLPLLSKKEYYKTVNYGYARGSEPVTYVTRIRNFEDILIQHRNNHQDDVAVNQ